MTCPSYETMDYIKEAKIFDENKIVCLHDPIINNSIILKKKKDLSIDSKNFKKRLFFKHWKT